MIFEEPIEFEDAIQSRKVKALLPTTLTNEEISALRAPLRERALWSARTANAGYVQKVRETLDKVLTPYFDKDGTTKGMDWGTARLELKDALKAIGYTPEPGERGRITDLSSDARLNLIIKTQTEMAQGYGRWQQGQTDAILNEWPAQELYRAEERMEPRDWEARWVAAGGQMFEGRMIALKNEPIWTQISAFGIPYPPFDFNSGMDVRDIDRDEAEELGLIRPMERVLTASRDFDQDSATTMSMAPELQDQLLKDLGPGYVIENGVLTRG